MSRPRGRKDMFGRARRVSRAALAAYIAAAGKRCRDIRLERDVPVVELSAATGICMHHIYRFERGEIRGTSMLGPTLATLIRIARALDIQPSELLP